MFSGRKRSAYHDCDFKDCESRSRVKLRRLKCMASDVEFSEGNLFLHQFVLDNSYPNRSGSEIYINAVLFSVSGTPVNTLNKDGYNPLHLSVLKKNLLMLKKILFCVRNVDVNATSGRDHNTALHLAIRVAETSTTLHELVDGGFYECYLGTNPEVPSGNLDFVKLLLENGADVEAENKFHETPLKIAAKFGNLELISLLCEKGANVRDALLCPVTLCNPYVINLLLDKGADARANSFHIQSPLHLAAKLSELESVKILVNRGADVNYFSLNWHCPAIIDALDSVHRNLDVIKALVDGGADLNARSGVGDTPLHYAVIALCGKDIINFLLESGANIRATNYSEETVLHFRRVYFNLDSIKFLVDKGADVNARDINNCTVLHYVAYSSRENLRRCYMNDIIAESSGKTSSLPPPPLLCISDIINCLLDLGADVNAQDENGNTPLHYACAGPEDNPDVVASLVRRGGIVDARNSGGKTPLDVAKEKNPSFVDMLENCA